MSPRLCPFRSSGRGLRGAWCWSALILLVPSSGAQGFGPRRVVSPGPSNVPVHECDVSAVADIPGRMVALWMSGLRPFTGPIYYAFSDSAVETWGNETLLSEPAADEADPVVGASADGRFVAAWLRLHDGQAKFDVYTARMGPASQVFAVPELISGEPDFFDFTRIALGPGQSGAAYAYVFCQHVDGFLYRSRLTDLESGSWGPLEPVWGSPEDRAALAAPAVAADGTLFVGCTKPVSAVEYRLRMIKSTDYGQSFSLVLGFDQFLPRADFGDYVAGTFRVAGPGNLVAHPTDASKLYLVYTDRTGAEDPETHDGDCDIYIRRSENGGLSWFAPKLVNGGAVGLLYDQFMPRVTVDAKGRIHVIYYDTRASHPALGDKFLTIELYYAVSTDGG